MGQAVALFSLGTMVGFASVLVSRHCGIFRMGLLLVLAVSCVLTISLSVLSLLLKPDETLHEEIPINEKKEKKVSQEEAV